MWGCGDPALSSRTTPFFIAAEEPVLSEAEGISISTAVERQPQLPAPPTPMCRVLCGATAFGSLPYRAGSPRRPYKPSAL